ncbi:MBL fold metallo-hydrolase [Vibrio sp. CK2-1]|uniref:MBL fold metallo-hydrolase RNA specificity domain-containing protein n=1 Tax=Vibrio sp. CK2-1 TaxID=2912249 RepID=UPI001F48D6A5|nr:MBL fold metallo-hydrolase [Vibrio sp. CK2-1]MCF7355404.1 MBL fold metallo-hydrolase [Vibrio sp. CK2-1]
MTTHMYQLHDEYQYFLLHHGGKNTVTGSCHELRIDQYGILIDCGLFQGKDSASDPITALNIDFDIQHIEALLITHTHIDHIGRLPWLLAAGFDKPIYCTKATAALIPLMLDDGLKLQLGLDKKQRKLILDKIERMIVPVEYGEWEKIGTCCELRERFATCCEKKQKDKSEKTDTSAKKAFASTRDTSHETRNNLSILFQPAGHILGSAYIEVKLPNGENIVFSGDLGPSNTPLLPDPIPPKQADYLVIETTYGDKQHDDVSTRSHRLEQIVQRSLQDGGVIIIPAFSVGRTQEILFDIERLIEHSIQTKTTSDDFWQQLPIILDSPLALKVTKEYEHFKQLWNDECIEFDENIDRHPLSFEQLIKVASHKEHIKLINRLASTNEPAIIVAASGMCNGGRIINYLQALLPHQQTDVILAGFQAYGTLGRELQEGEDHVYISNQKVKVNAQVHSMSGYSAHADQSDLLRFIEGIEKSPKKIFLIHGEPEVQGKFKELLKARFTGDIID